MKAILLLLSLAAPCFARIGETKEQCIERYGDVSLSFDKTLVFKKNGIEVVVEFRADTATSITYEKSAEPFSENEVKKLLNLNGPEVTWVKTTSRGISNYKDTKNVLTAHYDPDAKSLVIQTIKSLKEWSEENKKAEAGALEGF